VGTGQGGGGVRVLHCAGPPAAGAHVGVGLDGGGKPELRWGKSGFSLQVVTGSRRCRPKRREEGRAESPPCSWG
jgi:hypothetical protein